MITLPTYSTLNIVLHSRFLENRAIKISVTRFKIWKRNADCRGGKTAIIPNPNPVKLWFSPAVCFPEVDYFMRPVQFSAAAWTSVTPTEIQAHEIHVAHKDGFRRRKKKTKPTKHKQKSPHQKYSLPIWCTEWLVYGSVFLHHLKIWRDLFLQFPFRHYELLQTDPFWTEVSEKYFWKNLKQLWPLSDTWNVISVCLKSTVILYILQGLNCRIKLFLNNG